MDFGFDLELPLLELEVRWVSWLHVWPSWRRASVAKRSRWSSGMAKGVSTGADLNCLISRFMQRMASSSSLTLFLTDSLLCSIGVSLSHSSTAAGIVFSSIIGRFLRSLISNLMHRCVWSSLLLYCWVLFSCLISCLTQQRASSIELESNGSSSNDTFNDYGIGLSLSFLTLDIIMYRSLKLGFSCS